MRLFVALDLRHLVERLTADPGLGRLTGHPVTAAGSLAEHQTVAEVAVVGNGDGLAARIVLVVGHIPP